MQPTLQLRMIG